MAHRMVREEAARKPEHECRVSPMAIRASFMISWSKNSNRFPKDIFLTRDRSKIPFIPARCRERCTEGIMRGAWVEIIIIGTHTLRAPVPIDSSIDTHQVQSVRRSVRQKCCAHTKKTKRRVLCPRVTQAAMIAAASFGLRRSGRFATATSRTCSAPFESAIVQSFTSRFAAREQHRNQIRPEAMQ